MMLFEKEARKENPRTTSCLTPTRERPSGWKDCVSLDLKKKKKRERETEKNPVRIAKDSSR